MSKNPLDARLLPPNWHKYVPRVVGIGCFVMLLIGAAALVFVWWAVGEGLRRFH